MPIRAICRTAAVLAAAVALLPGSATAAAAGVWGAGHYPYVDGRVCRSGPFSSPLAAWSVDGGHLGYLTGSVVSNGRTDSAAPPVAAAGAAQPPTPVAPGAGFGNAQDIAAVAYLLDRGGDGATLAAAVLSQTDPGQLPPCADRAGAQAALAQARQRSGPYQVSVAGPSGTVRPGVATPVTATVRTAAGTAVPGVQVTFSAADADVPSPGAVTDGGGVAHGSVRVHDGAPAAVQVTATVRVATGLLQATVAARRTPTNPAGASVPAVYPAPPATYSGQTQLAVDQSAHPVVSTALDSHLVEADVPFTPQADVSGLNGHSADLTFELLGPLPLADGTLCRQVPAADWTSPDVHVASTSSVTVTGDGTATGGALTGGQPGCYAVRSTVATVDATPAAVKTAPLAVVAVLDTAVTRADDQPAVLAAHSPGDVTGELQVGDTHGLPGRVQAVLVGPIQPADGNCAPDAPAWAKAGHTTVQAQVRALASTATAVTGAGGYQYRFTAPDQVGCYRYRPAVTLSAPGGDTLTVYAGDSRPAYVLDPTISAAVRQTWAVSPAAVPVAVQVDGLYGLAAHVRLAMYVAPADPTGCAQASFTSASRAGDGPDAEVPAQPGPLTVPARSGPTPKQGCYAVVPELTLDAAPQVRLAGAVGSPGSILIAGVDPHRQLRLTSGAGGGGTATPFLIAVAALAGLLLLVAGRVALVAWRDRDGPPGVAWDAFRGEVLHLPDEELPSGS